MLDATGQFADHAGVCERQLVGHHCTARVQHDCWGTQRDLGRAWVATILGATTLESPSLSGTPPQDSVPRSPEKAENGIAPRLLGRWGLESEDARRSLLVCAPRQRSIVEFSVQESWRKSQRWHEQS